MRRALVMLALPALALVGCGDVEQAVREGVRDASEVAEDARQQIEDTSRDLRFCTAALSTAEAARDGDWSAATEAGEELVAVAPPDIADDARTVLDGARAYQDGDTSAVADEAFRSAVERVAEHTRETCDPRA